MQVDVRTPVINIHIPQAVKWKDGAGILNISKTSSVWIVDTYTITYSDDSTSIFNITNGIDWENGKSAFEIAVDNWFSGTVEDRLISLHWQDWNDGNDWQSQYIYTAYASDWSWTGADFTWSSPLKYMAIQITSSPTPPILWSFTGWKKFIWDDWAESWDMLSTNNLSDVDDVSTDRDNVWLWDLATEDSIAWGDVTGKPSTFTPSAHTHTVSQISDITATASELNILDWATLTTTELNYVDWVTSAIQTQLNESQCI